MSFSQSQFPGQSCMVDGALGSGARSSVVAGDKNNLCACLCNTGCNGADACFRDKFYCNTCFPVCIFQIINKLRQIFNGINIVMRRRRDQGYAGGRVPGLGNPRIHLFTGKMSAFAGLCALCHFDLNFLGRKQIFARHAEAARRHLLNGGIARGA